MTEKSPALIYFWNHQVSEELDTPTLKDLVSRVETLFLEFVCLPSHCHLRDSVEFGWNHYLATGFINNPSLLGKGGPFFDHTLFLANLMRGTNGPKKRFVLERTTPPTTDFHTLDGDANRFFYVHPNVDRVVQVKQRILRAIRDYVVPREREVASQIGKIESPTLVLFGMGHQELPDLVREYRPVEIFYPFEDFPIPYGVELQNEFNSTGEVNPELFFRSMIEYTCQGELQARNTHEMTYHEIFLVSHHYAEILTTEQILGYREKVITTPTKWLGDVFDKFLEEQKLPSISTVLEDLRKKIE